MIEGYILVAIIIALIGSPTLSVIATYLIFHRKRQPIMKLLTSASKLVFELDDCNIESYDSDAYDELYQFTYQMYALTSSEDDVHYTTFITNLYLLFNRLQIVDDGKIGLNHYISNLFSSASAVKDDYDRLMAISMLVTTARTLIFILRPCRDCRVTPECSD